MSQRSDRGIEMALSFQLSQNFTGELVIAGLHCFGGTFQAGPSARRIEELDGFVAQGFVESIAKLTGAGEAMPGLLRHALVYDAADRLTHGRVDVGSRRRNLVANRLDDLIGA